MDRIEFVFELDTSMTDMTPDELTELNYQLTDVRQQVRRVQQRLNAIYSDKAESDDVRRVLDGMTDDQRNRLAQYIQTEGIPSEENVNG